MNFKNLNPFNKSDEKKEPVAPSPYLRKPVRSHAQEVFSTLRIILFLSFSGSLTLRVLRGGNSAGFLILRIREPFFSVKFFRFILWHM